MMLVMRAFALTTLSCLALTNANAQSFVPDTSSKPAVSAPSQAPFKPVIRPKKPKAISKEWSVGARLTTDGWSAFVDLGKVKSDDSRNSDRLYNIRLIQIELSEHKHVKEIKTTNEYLRTANEKPKSFIYGKLNNFYSLKGGYGYRRMIAGKPDPGTVSIHWVYLGGLTVGFEKPYYVDAYVPQDNFGGTRVRESIRYTDDTKGDFLTQQYIIGSSGWTKGFDNLKIIPGLHGKTGLHFDFTSKKNRVLAIETGVSAELYTRRIELLANQKASPLLLNGYVSLQFGKRK